MALRFLGEESDRVPKDRVLASLRLLLNEPKLADLVIADLARWQDWSAIDRLVELFEKAEADNIFVREPIVNYLRACPLPQAAEAIARLEKIDPEAVRRAATLAAFSGAIGAASGNPAAVSPTDGSPAPATPGGSGPTANKAGGPADATDGDPGDPSMARVEAAGSGPALPSAAATPSTTAAEVAIAARIPAVLADEEATDDAPGIDPTRPVASRPQSGPAPAAAAAPEDATWSRWKWLVGAGILFLIAVVARSRLWTGGTGPSDNSSRGR